MKATELIKELQDIIDNNQKDFDVNVGTCDIDEICLEDDTIIIYIE